MKKKLGNHSAVQQVSSISCPLVSHLVTIIYQYNILILNLNNDNLFYMR